MRSDRVCVEYEAFPVSLISMTSMYNIDGPMTLNRNPRTVGLEVLLECRKPMTGQQLLNLSLPTTPIV